VLVADDFHISAAQGILNTDRTAAAIVHEFIAAGTTASIVLDGADVTDLTADRNPLLNGLTLEVIPSSAYTIWAAAKGLIKDENDGYFDDPNLDGTANIAHFAFNTNPLGHGGGEGKQRTLVADVAGNDHFILTLPVRTGAVFAGSPAPSASIDGISYRIEGTANFTAWDQSLLEVSPIDPADLPALDSGWEYRAFRFSASVADLPSAFMRAVVIDSP